MMHIPIIMPTGSKYPRGVQGGEGAALVAGRGEMNSPAGISGFQGLLAAFLRTPSVASVRSDGKGALLSARIHRAILRHTAPVRTFRATPAPQAKDTAPLGGRLFVARAGLRIPALSPDQKLLHGNLGARNTAEAPIPIYLETEAISEAERASLLRTGVRISESMIPGTLLVPPRPSRDAGRFGGNIGESMDVLEMDTFGDVRLYAAAFEGLDGVVKLDTVDGGFVDLPISMIFPKRSESPSPKIVSARTMIPTGIDLSSRAEMPVGQTRNDLRGQQISRGIDLSRPDRATRSIPVQLNVANLTQDQKSALEQMGVNLTQDQKSTLEQMGANLTDTGTPTRDTVPATLTVDPAQRLRPNPSDATHLIGTVKLDAGNGRTVSLPITMSVSEAEGPIPIQALSIPDPSEIDAPKIQGPSAGTPAQTALPIRTERAIRGDTASNPAEYDSPIARGTSTTISVDSRDRIGQEDTSPSTTPARSIPIQLNVANLTQDQKSVLEQMGVNLTDTGTPTQDAIPATMAVDPAQLLRPNPSDEIDAPKIQGPSAGTPAQTALPIRGDTTPNPAEYGVPVQIERQSSPPQMNVAPAESEVPGRSFPNPEQPATLGVAPVEGKEPPVRGERNLPQQSETASMPVMAVAAERAPVISAAEERNPTPRRTPSAASGPSERHTPGQMEPETRDPVPALSGRESQYKNTTADVPKEPQIVDNPSLQPSGSSEESNASGPTDQGRARSDLYPNAVPQVQEVRDPSPARPAPSAPAPPAPEDPPVVQQVVRNARFLLRTGRSEFTVQLRPEHLGLMKMRLVLEENAGVRVEASVQSETTRQVIESSLSELRDSMNELGVRIEKFDVSVGEEFLDSMGYREQSGRREETSPVSAPATQDVEARNEDSSRPDRHPRSLGYNTVEFVA